MINNWDEITSRYDLIKDHKPRATKKLKELGEILASAYRLDPQRADEMWQYVIELNISDDITFSKFYIAQVFNKLTTFLTPEEATQFVTMRPERVRLMLMYGYDGGTLNHIVYIIVGYQVLNEKMDDAIEILSVLKDKFSIQDELNNYTFYSVLNNLCARLEEHSEQNDYSFRYDIPLESIFSLYNICSCEFEDEYIQTILQIRKCLLTGKIIGDTESVKRNFHYLTELAIKNGYEFNYLFTEYLFFERDVIGSEAENIIFEYYSESNRIYLSMVSSYCEDEKLLEKSNWYQQIIINSQRILRELFRKERCQDFLKKVIQSYMYENEWKSFLQFLVLGLNQETESNESSYLEFIKEEIRDYLLLKGKRIEFEDNKWWVVNEQSNISLSESEENSINSNTGASFYTWRSSITKPRVTKDNINDFITALSRACLLTSSSPINEQLVDEVRAFVTKEKGNVDTLLEMGMEVEADNRTELEKFIDYAEKESHQRIPCDNSRTPNYDYIRNIERETGTYGVETGKLLAKQPSILSFLFLHDAHSFSIKENIILGALLDGNYSAALKCVDYMIETASYPNFSDRNSWSMEMKNTLSYILRSVFQKNTSEYDQPYPENVTSTVIQIVEKCLPYLGGDDANEVKANLVKLKPSDEGKDDFVRQLLKDVDDYTAEKKPKGYSKRLNNITSGIMRGIEVLTELNRMDIVAQILRKITEGKKYIAGPSYESWMTNNLWRLSNEQLLELYSLIPDVYAGYIEDSNSIMALNLLKQFGETGNQFVYNALKSQVLQKHGYIEGMRSCFHHSLETTTPIFLCKNEFFEASFFYWNINSFNYRTGIFSTEIVLQVKNLSNEYISLFASDISINGIPMTTLKNYDDNNNSERETISYYLATGESDIESFTLYWGNQRKESFKEIFEISFSIIAQRDENDIAKEGLFTIVNHSNDDSFALKK